MIELAADSIGKSFGVTRVLSAASLRAMPGRITALFGRNGCGKSTLVRIMAGHMSADHGHIRLGGEVLVRPKAHLLARAGVYYAPDDNALSYWIPLHDQLAGVARFAGTTPSLDAVIERFDLRTLLDREAYGFSTGERKRAAIALAFLRRPAVLLADEPLSGIAPLDRELIVAALRTLADDGTAILVTGHEASDLLAASDLVAWLNGGTLRILGSSAAAQRDHAFRRDYLGLAPARLDAARF